MTLVIANKIKNKISLSSDSRISFGAAFIDFGIKIFTVPVKITSPIDSETGKNTIIYNKKLGLAITGNVVNAYTVKESVYEILQNLQYIPTHTEVSMNSIANLVFKVYKKTCIDLLSILGEKGVSELILSGYCPLEDKIKTYVFTVDPKKYPRVPKFDEILISDEIILYGSGKKMGEEIHHKNPNFSPLFILRAVINDQNEMTVGGGLQYGEFDLENNFNIYGVEDYELNTDGSFKEYKHQLRGIEIYRKEFERDVDDFHISYSFKRPFITEIDHKLQEYLDRLEEGRD